MGWLIATMQTGDVVFRPATGTGRSGMTEAERLVSGDPFAMLRAAPAGNAARKRVLVVCGAWQQIRQLLPETPSLQALTALEQLAEDAATVPPTEMLRLALAIEEPLW